MKQSNRNPKSWIFVGEGSLTSVCLNLEEHPSDEFESYAEAYRRAGKAAFTAHFEPETDSDYDFLPIGFLYRHACELYLKAIVRRGNTLREFHKQSPVPVRDTHRLTLLLEDVRPIFESMGWRWNAERGPLRGFDDLRRCLRDLEKDDVLGIDDSQADMFRYPGHTIRRGGDATHQLPKRFVIEVREFVRRLDVVLHYLCNAAHELVHILDNEMRSYAEGYHDDPYADQRYEDELLAHKDDDDSV